MLLLHLVFYGKNFQILIDTLIINNHSLQLIFKVLHNRIKYLINHKFSLSIDKFSNTIILDDKSKFFVILFIKNFSNTQNLWKSKKVFAWSIKVFNLNKYIKVLKDPVNLDKKHVVYKLECKNWSVIRWSNNEKAQEHKLEHKNQLNHNNNNISVVTQHCIDGSWL